MARERIGVWFVGAKGGVASTAIVGLIALRKGLVGPAGLVSELPEFKKLGLASWRDIVVGGHEIRDVSSWDEAQRMHTESRAIDADVLRKCKADLDRIDRRIRPGTDINVGSTIRGLAGPKVRRRRETPRAAVERIRSDLKRFVKNNKLSRVVVVNVASTEPGIDLSDLPSDWESLDALLDKPRKCPLSASSLYAIAALDLGHAFINFTPSPGASPEAIGQLAEMRGACHMGYDGKTGETLLKSVLAPMFAKRNLPVMSWVGHNIFGNMDGKVLEDPTNKKAKVDSKDKLLGKILGYTPQTLVSIEYIESMHDWKTAWDHIHFQGFLGTPMAFQFIWQGCDSLLAAPLVLDLVRFTERAARAGQTGLLTFLASFFKSPLGVEENDFALQYLWLEEWARQIATSRAARSS